mgnify:CR=1 FL=1
MSSIEDLPDEIILKILTNIEFGELVFSWSKVSKKFRAISQDKSLWKKVNIWDQNTPLGKENKLFKMVALILVDMDGSMPNLEVVCKDNLNERSIVLEAKQISVPTIQSSALINTRTTIRPRNWILKSVKSTKHLS